LPIASNANSRTRRKLPYLVAVAWIRHISRARPLASRFAHVVS